MSKSYLLIDLLNSFSKQELNDFIEFSSCKYHNTDIYAFKLLKFLINNVVYENSFNERLQFDAFKIVFKDKVKKTKKINQKQKSFLLAKMNVLIRLAENFLCYELLKSKSSKRNPLLLKQILNKGQILLFKRNEQKEQKKLASIKAKNIEDYEELYQIELKRLDYLHKTGSLIKEDNIEALNKYLDIYYILRKISIHLSGLSLAQLSAQKKYQFNVFDDMEFLLKKPIYFEHPLIKAFIVTSNLLETGNIKYHTELLELLQKHNNDILKTDLRDFYLLIANFCSKKIKEGNNEYYKYVFEYYDLMNKDNLIIENNFVQVGLLKNIVTVACKVNEYIWASNMVEKYKTRIQKEFRLSVYHQNLGVIEFYRKQYDQALNHFIKVDKVNLAYDIDCRIMILKCHYELDKEYDERAMRRFVMAERYIQANKKLIKNDKKAYKNFIRILLNIYRVKHKATRMTLESLLDKIEKAEFISDKKWLLDKIDLLENSLSK